MPEDLEVVKSGVCWVELSLRRNHKGLTVWVKTVPEVEEFIRNSSHGNKDAMEMYGRGWVANDLQVYRLDKPMGAVSGNYNLTKVSEPMEGAPLGGGVNLSFLRFVGISNPLGVEFLIPEPFSQPYVTRISHQIVLECKHFVKDYIVPMEINLRISSQSV